MNTLKIDEPHVYVELIKNVPKAYNTGIVPLFLIIRCRK